MDKYLSKKEYLEKYDSNAGYALYVQNNIKKDDYARLNTGKIVRVIGIKENKLNKKAIYFGIYEQDWFDSMAVENFSDNIIDLIEVGDFVNGFPILEPIYNGNTMYGIDEGYENFKKSFGEIKTILTGESYMANCYKVGGEDE